MSTSHLSYENVWNNVDEPLVKELTALWMNENVLADESAAKERAQQVVCIGRDEDGKIAGVCTIYKQQNQRIGYPFYYYRSLVRSDARQHGVAGHLIVNAWNHMQSLTVDGQVDECVGFCVIVENEHLLKNKKEAVWPLSKLMYIGPNATGQPMRIRYFEGATL